MLFPTVLLTILCFVSALPLGMEYRGLEYINFLEDDIIFPLGYDTRSGLLPEIYRWPNKRVIYVIEGFEFEDENELDIWIREFNKLTCVELVRRSNTKPESDYVVIKKGAPGTGCKSSVGRRGGKQVLNLQYPHCFSYGIFAHEVVHAIGFYHEHARFDRDNYLKINWTNIPDDQVHNFLKRSNTSVFGVPYDYWSIMQYGRFDFSIDPKYPTMIPKLDGVPLGGKILTRFDRAKINAMYNCPNWFLFLQFQ